MKYNLEGKIFELVRNSKNGDTDETTVFRYHQDGDLVWADYRGGTIVKGHLIAKIEKDGVLNMRYHHIDKSGEIKLGKCLSNPVLLPDGRLKFEERWQWLTGDMSEGYSEIIESPDPGLCRE